MKYNKICPYCKKFVDSDLQMVTRGQGRFRETQYFHEKCYVKNTRGAMDAFRLRNNASSI